MPRPMRRLAQAFHSATSLAISSERAAARLDIGLVIARPLSLVRWSWSRRWVGFLVGVRCYCSLCSLGAACRWFACLLCAVLRFCLVLSCYNEAPLLVRVSAGRGQPLCPWDRGDKVVSARWWVRACFIHPETLFQTLPQVISRRIRPRLAPRTPFNNNPAGAVFHRLL